ncbi:MarR family winged helix-turn-helix transcriptional regulator [Brevundimonas sp.]|jgi:DNA-binding MarR family transcriptional regulator|uniref:MarR family winged helix-turn-helix transcriptional regulator n=1 Tax=Brevundimonas sp. TaxID=1871086 RepID=UPI0037838B4B
MTTSAGSNATDHERQRESLTGGLEVWPQLDPFAATVRWQLLQLGQLVQASVDRVAAANGLTHAEVAILGALKRIGPPFEASPSRLQNAHWVTLPGLTKPIARLEALGLVTRRINPADRRAAIVALTPEGNRKMTDIIENQAPPEYWAIADLPPERRAAIEAVLPDLLGMILAAVPEE